MTIKERPILFTGQMVRALLDGSKTQTRRVGKLQSDHYVELAAESIGHATKGHVIQATYAAFPGKGSARWAICECPYGQPGDRLWVRETFIQGYHCVDGMPDAYDEEDNMKPVHTWYRADQQDFTWCDGDGFTMESIPWKPSIHMPRTASRITLEITGVRVERLNSISEADAIAEGIQRGRDGMFNGAPHAVKGTPRAFHTAIGAYDDLWTHINGVGSWAANPWVWVIEFKRVKP